MNKFEQVASDDHQMSTARGKGSHQVNKFEEVSNDDHRCQQHERGSSSGLMSGGGKGEGQVSRSNVQEEWC